MGGGWTVGRFIHVCGVTRPRPSGGRGRETHKIVCVYLLPIGAQTSGPNGLQFGMEVWDGPWNGLAVGVIRLRPIWAWQSNAIVFWQAEFSGRNKIKNK